MWDIWHKVLTLQQVFEDTCRGYFLIGDPLPKGLNYVIEYRNPVGILDATKVFFILLFSSTCHNCYLWLRLTGVGDTSDWSGTEGPECSSRWGLNWPVMIRCVRVVFIFIFVEVWLLISVCSSFVWWMEQCENFQSWLVLCILCNTSLYFQLIGICSSRFECEGKLFGHLQGQTKHGPHDITSSL
jgi:hypothetical protein